MEHEGGAEVLRGSKRSGGAKSEWRRRGRPALGEEANTILGRHRRVLSGGSSAVREGSSGFRQFRA
eukprot:10485319-Alexandrium_andersonii.AAC.1